jgi:hypothetical protein
MQRIFARSVTRPVMASSSVTGVPPPITRTSVQQMNFRLDAPIRHACARV